MFKPALFVLDRFKPHVGSNIKEVWFARKHGDVGGGWDCNSEIPLRWMIEEVIALPEEVNRLAWQNTKVAHAARHGDKFEDIVLPLLAAPVTYQVPKVKKLKKLVHGLLAFGGGVSTLTTCSWCF